jgi:hypothetical protein
MRRIRQWLTAAFLAVLLTLSFASVASADPGDGAVPSWFADPGDGAVPTSDPGDGAVPMSDPGDGAVP